MKKQHNRFSLLAAALVAAGAANAADYVTAHGAPLRTAFGDCVRTGYWEQASVGCGAKRVVATFEAPRREAAALKVFFGFDEAALDDDARRALDDLLRRIAVTGVERIVAVGYADALGPEKYNQRLSELRAKAVRDYLVEKGVPMQAFTLEAKGKSEPQRTAACEGISDKEDAAKLVACLAPDRRVEIKAVALRPAD